MAADASAVVLWVEVARWTFLLGLVGGVSWKARGMFGKVYRGQAEGVASVVRLTDHVERQNGRIKSLEESVMYRDTCNAMHGQNANGIERMEKSHSRVEERVDELHTLVSTMCKTPP